MLKLKNVDLIIIDCINPEQAVKTLDICSENIEFGNSIIFTHENIETNNHEIVKITNLDSIEKYSDFCLKINNYIDNDYVLIVQNDGFILNPELWSDVFLNYDYIGAPWMQTSEIRQKVGNGGFSLRSKKFLNFSSFYETTNGIPEDNFLCINKYQDAIDFGIVYAKTKIANQFAFELPNMCCEIFNPSKHFGFHGKHNLEIVSKYIKNR